MVNFHGRIARSAWLARYHNRTTLTGLDYLLTDWPYVLVFAL